MTIQPETTLRLVCLQLATQACGADTDPEFVLEGAQSYYAWLMGKKPELRFRYIQDNAKFVDELDV